MTTAAIAWVCLVVIVLLAFWPTDDDDWDGAA